MALFKPGFLFAVFLAVLAVAELVGSAAAATYVVGDSLGWTVPTGGAATYSSWASRHVFAVGDVLVFNFTTGQHDVAKVTRGAFDGCSSTNPIGLATVGPASFTLNSTGEDHYICTFGQHCSLGQKLVINVTAAASAPAPGPSPPTNVPTPSPMLPPLPSPSPSPTNAPPPSPMLPPSAPSPTPGGSITPPPSPVAGESPGSTPSPSSLPNGGLGSPPPPGSSATMTTIGSPLVIFISFAIGLIIII